MKIDLKTFLTNMPEDMFMAECKSRTKNTEKCNYCELRFKCFTQRGMDDDVVIASGVHMHSISTGRISGGWSGSGSHTHLPP